MKIDEDHKFHGAALVQIAEDPHFTAINALKLNGETARNAYRINDNIGVYLKYATKPVTRYKEYRFTFSKEHLDLLVKLKSATGKVYLALVCVSGREICCLPYEKLLELIEARHAAKGSKEEQYVIPVVLPQRKSFRVYINSPGERGRILGEEHIVSRNDFPSKLFI